MQCKKCGVIVPEGAFCLRCGWKQAQQPVASTLGAIHNRWKKRKHYRELSAKGKEGYDLAWKRLCVLSEKEIQRITFDEYQGVLDNMADEGLSKSTQEKVQQLVSQLNKLGIREGLLTVNLGQELVLEGRARKESLTFEDQHIPRMIEYAKSSENRYHHAAMVTLCLIFTAYRPEEFFHIRCEDLDPAVPILVAGSKTEAGKNRMVPILSVIRPYIEKWYLSCPIRNGKREGYLVRGPKGGKKDLGNWRAREFYPMTLELGINQPNQLNQKRKVPHITPYSARHTFATLAYRADVDKEALSKMVGHLSFETTHRFYIHSELEAMRREANKIESYLAEKMPFNIETKI